MDTIMEFKSFRLMNIELNTHNSKNNNNGKTQLRVNAGTTEINDDGEAQLEIEININEEGEDYTREIKVIVLGIFKFPNQPSDYDLEELLKVNGTAILIPYIRSMISSLTSFDDSTEHLLLPAINVNAMFNQRK
ncbi:hypothetical protein BU645_11790 [Staphylococcus chromogenes]|uniref:protein-export chaperone SecB n=1 Tax=Staphylococcus chromogenes TaxID=46126 RepID=UPI000D1A458B|nr:protein-export chaperone SecB [Staphylococcus chromogenes]PTG88113.1 hypothetical protein BU645_11790 [Staphylococcus chromogenes]